MSTERGFGLAEELMIAEPVFATMLRLLTDRGVILHLDDSSRILGKVDRVSESGDLVELTNGPSTYVVDAAKIAVVETGAGIPRAVETNKTHPVRIDDQASGR